MQSSATLFKSFDEMVEIAQRYGTVFEVFSNLHFHAKYIINFLSLMLTVMTDILY